MSRGTKRGEPAERRPWRNGGCVIVSPASSMRLGRISRTIEAIRCGTVCGSPYLSRAWMRSCDLPPKLGPSRE